MAIQLKYEEDFSRGLKRLILNECQNSLEYLRNANTDNYRHETVHEVRKSYKKIRACLRLVRDQIDFFKEENRWFRDQAREISELRDSTAILEVLHILRNQYKDFLKAETFQMLDEKLRIYRKHLANQYFHQVDKLSVLQQALEEKAEEIPEWNIQVYTFEGVKKGLKRTYKRGYKGLEKVNNSGDIKDFHEWRKRVKYTCYHLDVLNRIRPKMFTSWEDELHDITDLTGTMHDLYNLKLTIKKLDHSFQDINERTLFHTLLEKYQDLMGEHAILKGKKFYTDSPDEFCERVQVFWKMHSKEIKDPDLPPFTMIETG